MTLGLMKQAYGIGKRVLGILQDDVANGARADTFFDLADCGPEGFGTACGAQQNGEIFGFHGVSPCLKQ